MTVCIAENITLKFALECRAKKVFFSIMPHIGLTLSWFGNFTLFPSLPLHLSVPQVTFRHVSCKLNISDRLFLSIV